MTIFLLFSTACAIAYLIVRLLRIRRAAGFPAPEELRRRFDDALREQYETEARCGYDQKIGMAAIGELAESVRSVPVSGSPAEYAGKVFAAASKAQDNCSLDGEYSSGKASIGSGICRLRSAVPEELLREIERAACGEQ